MKTVMISGDILRATPEFEYHQLSNMKWFSAIVRQSLSDTADVFTSEISDDSILDFPDLFRSIYGEPGPGVVDRWARYYDTIDDDALRSKLTEIYRDKIVVIFEASRAMLRFLNDIGCKYLNFRVSPVKFAADLIFMISSNDPTVQQVLRCYAIDDGFVAAERTALAARLSSAAPAFERPTLVFLGQSRIDSSLIADGRLVQIAIPADLDISRFASDDVFHKPHPYDPNEPAMALWQGFFPNSRLMDIPTYRLFSGTGELVFVTVSSGAGCEAQLFGHECHFISPHNWSLTSPAWIGQTSVLHEYWYPAFWRTIGNALNGRVSSVADISTIRREMIFVPDRLRKAVNTEWSSRF